MTAKKVAEPKKVVAAKTVRKATPANRAIRRTTAKAQKAAPPVEHKERPRGNVQRISDLELQVRQLIWLHAELSYSIRLAVAKQVAATKARAAEQQMVEQMMQGPMVQSS